MRMAIRADVDIGSNWQARLIYAFLLPLFVAAEGVSRLFARWAEDESEPAPPRGSWAAEARSQASIATSCALMAQSMLQSSERRSRPERLSRP